MKILDINSENAKTILLIPPMFATAELIKTLLVELMGDGYRYLVADLSGFGAAADQTYKSAEEEAKQIRDYLLDNQITIIKMGFGTSLGGTVLMQLLRISDTSFEHLFFEGTSFLKNGNITAAVTKAVFLHKHRKAVAHPEIAVRKMRALYSEAAAKIMAYQIVSIDEESLKNMVWDCAHVTLPTLSLEQQKNCVFAYGQKDADWKQAKKQYAIEYPAAKIRLWPGYAHCTKITEDPQGYALLLVQEVEQ